MSDAAFPPTHHSAVLGARSEDPEARERARRVIVSAYWRPAYAYVRWRWRVQPEDAEDLVQGFFTRALEKEFFAAYDPGKARFRTFLRTCLDGYVANERRAAGRLKRGGGVPLLPLDFETAEGELLARAVPDPVDPEMLFEREWVRSLFGLAVERLRAECAADGKDVHFALFERYDLEGSDAPERPTYRSLGEAFGLTETQVTNHLATARRGFRRIVLEALREICGSDAEFRAEARAVLGGDP
jgi:RNA polymerase sigma factor (sigma-70 family)